ncbi:MAG: hypothetical protein U0795_25715 [Pirellulales bacterium]
MFILAERKQRRLARLLFLIGCLTPTLVVAAWSVYRQTSTEADRYSATLSASLGTQVIIERVWHPRPRLTILDRLICRDPVTGSTWARVGQVRIDRRGETPDIELVQAEFIVEEPDSLANMIARSLPSHSIHRLASTLHAQRMTIHWESAGQLSDLPLAMTVEQLRVTAADAETVEVAGLLNDPTPIAPGSQASRTTHFTLTCSRGQSASTLSQPTQPSSIAATAGSPVAVQPAPMPNVLTSRRPTCTLTLKTQSGPLPVYLFAPQLARQLGPSARFQGTIQTAWAGRHQELTVHGHFTDWNLQRGTRDWSHHGLWGLAQLELEDCRVTNGRLTQARGRLQIAQAEASQILVDRLAMFWHGTLSRQSRRTAEPTRPMNAVTGTGPGTDTGTGTDTEPAADSTAEEQLEDPVGPAADDRPSLVWDFEIDTRRSLVRVDSAGSVQVRDQSTDSLTLAGTLERPLAAWVRLMLPPTDDGLPATAQTLPYLQHLEWPAHETTLAPLPSTSVAEPTGQRPASPERSETPPPTPVVRLRGAGTWK